MLSYRNLVQRQGVSVKPKRSCDPQAGSHGRSLWMVGMIYLFDDEPLAASTFLTTLLCFSSVFFGCCSDRC